MKKEFEKMPVKVEGNLIEYPFFHLGGRKTKKISKEYNLGEKNIENGITVNRKLTVKNADGIPGPYDQDVLMGILRIGTKKNKLTEDIPLTIYELAKEIDDIAHRGRVRKSIEKLVSTTYTSKQVVLVKEKEEKYYLDDMFHILDSVTFLDSEQKNKRKSNQVTKVRFNNFFITNFLNDYYKYVDFGKYLSIRSPIAKKLYMYLEKKKHNKTTYQVNLDNLARVLPLEVTEKYQIRWILKKANETLIEESIIEGFEFNKEKVIYRFTKVEKPSFIENVGGSVLEKMDNVGVTKKVAEELINKYGEEKIKEQIDFLKHRKGDNKAGLLIKSVIDNWAPPQQHTEKIEKMEKERILENQRREEEKKREEEFMLDEKINEIIKNMSVDEIETYNEKAKELFKQETNGISEKYFMKPHRESIIKRLIAEDKGILN